MTSSDWSYGVSNGHWPLSPVVTLAEIGAAGTALSTQDGQSRSVAPLIRHPDYLLKLYKTLGDREDAARLDRLIALPDTGQARGDVLRSHTSWPVARVSDSRGGAAGCVIPRAPSRFRALVGSATKTDLLYLDVDLLAKPAEGLARRGLPALSSGDRLSVVGNLLEVAAAFETLSVVYSDWSYSNAFWNVDGDVYVIDVDGCHFVTGPNVYQPNWEDPLTSRTAPADHYVDRYRVALLAARCLTGKRALLDVLAALTSQPLPCTRAFADAMLDVLLARGRELRPSSAELRAVLQTGLYVVLPGHRRSIPELLAARTQTPRVRPASPTGHISTSSNVKWPQSAYASSTPASGGTSVARQTSTGSLPATAQQGISSGAKNGLAAAVLVGSVALGVVQYQQRPASPPRVSATAQAFPQGDHITVSWSDVDSRRGRETRLEIVGGEASGDCPGVITGSGSCSFKGEWGTMYTATATTYKGEDAQTSNSSQVTTFVSPSVGVAAGPVITDDGEQYCQVLVTLQGLAPSTTYAVTTSNDYDVRTGDAPDTYQVQTDGKGNVSDAPLSVSYRDPDGVGWFSIRVAGLTARRDPWNCP